MVEASPHRVHLQRSLVEFPREIDGQDEERGGADPVRDERGVHADVAGDLAVPVARGLHLVEAVLERVFVVRPGSFASVSVRGQEQRGEGGLTRSSART